MLLVAVGAGAQDESSTLDRIEVTGSRISYHDLLDTPAISLTKRGDYLSQGVTLVNDTRDEEGRRREIVATIDKLIARAGERYEVLYGDSYPIVLRDGSEIVQLQEDAERPDVSRVSLRVRTSLPSTGPAGVEQVRALRSFAAESPVVGRTEIELDDDTALGMQRPERYRYELLEAIAADTNRVRETIGSGCKVEIDGLNSRIEWERVGATDLLLYVPYTLAVLDCGGAAGSGESAQDRALQSSGS